jgi:excisionase family DNA binding protein
MFTTAAVAPLPRLHTLPTMRRAYWRATGAPRRFDATNQPLVVSVPEACTLLRVSRWTLYQLIRSGKLETVTIGTRRLVPVSALYELLTRLSGEERP